MENENCLNAKMEQPQMDTMCRPEIPQTRAVNASYYGDCETNSKYRPPTLREQAEKNAALHATQAQKHSEAATFLMQHPEFDEFIRLIRSGALQF